MKINSIARSMLFTWTRPPLRRVSTAIKIQRLPHSTFALTA